MNAVSYYCIYCLLHLIAVFASVICSNKEVSPITTFSLQAMWI